MSEQPSRPLDPVRLLASGLSVEDVAQQTGVDRRQAAAALTRAVDAAAADSLDRDGERVIELTHLSMLRRALMPAAMRGDVPAVRALVLIAAARAELLDLALVQPPLAPPNDEGEVDVVDELRAARAARRATAG